MANSSLAFCKAMPCINCVSHNLQQELPLTRNSIKHDPIAVEKLERFIYTVATDRMQATAATASFDEVDKYRRQTAKAREALPQFNREGLWVGKYGEQGFEMINVTYQGDTSTAYKVRGDRNVPKGQAFFTVDLSPDALDVSSSLSSSRSRKEKILEPIELATKDTKQWVGKFMQRFSGNGHVASKVFVNSQWIDGQLILVWENTLALSGFLLGIKSFLEGRRRNSP
jgi:hypothetical protein